MGIISDDLLPEILSRLPIKSLFQFKCVSKRFYQIITSIISDPKLLALESVHGFFHFSYRSPQNIRYLSLHPQHHPVENSGWPINSHQILDSCNGLLLLNLVDGFSLYNPTIKKHRYIPKPIDWSPSPKQNIGLAYEPSGSISNSFWQLVFVYKIGEYEVPGGREEYGFEIFAPYENEWINVEVDAMVECESGEFVKQGQAVYFDDALHWIRDSGEIIGFNAKVNMAGVFSKPIFLKEFKPNNMWFGVTRGSLNVLYISKRKTQVVILVLHDYEEEKWGCVRIKIDSWPLERAFCPIFFDGDLIVFQSQGELKEIHSYSLRLKEWKKIGVILDSEDEVQEYIPFIPSLAWLDLDLLKAPSNNNYLEGNYSNSRFEHFWPSDLRRRSISQVPSDSRSKRVI